MLKKMIEIAKSTISASYSPYSGYRVSAVLRSDDGSMFTGVNIENGSYSVTMCAERTALFKAVSEGRRSFTDILVYSDSDRMPYPCGSCLQALSEFSGDGLNVYISNGSATERYMLSELFPKRFKL